MKNLGIVATLALIAVFFSLIITNPSTKEFAKYLKHNETSIKWGPIVNSGNPTQVILSKEAIFVLMFSSVASVERQTYRHNYIIFSTFKYDGIVRAVGVAGNFFITN
ncbi:MAG: hypothetical protein M0003_01075 [Acidithiobacillus sp.]|nr:hypothetical protein [Acidithiobacillus sp.]